MTVPPFLAGKGVRGLGSWLLALLLGVAVALAGWASISSGSVLAYAPAEAPSFELTSQLGQPTSLADLRGKPVLLTFLYTYCPDTCPLYLSNIASGLRTLKNAGGDLPAVVVVTVDPDRDTVERLREYAGAWPSDWLFLTGGYQQVSRVWKSYGMYVEKQPLPHSSEVHHGYTVVHSGKVVLVDREGKLADELRGSWTPQDLVATLRNVGSQPGVVARVNLLAALDELIRKCGELAATQPALVVGFIVVIMLPGLILPVYLLRTFLGTKDDGRWTVDDRR